MDDKTDSKKILTAFPSEDWKKLPGRPQITWMKAVLNDVESHNLILTEAVNSESPALEIAGCKWHYALLVVQARNDDDDDNT